MPRLHPFQAVRFADDSDLTTKIAPPYDVLDEEPKRELLERDHHNIVEIDLPVTPPKTVGPDEAYAAAAGTYRHWLNSGVLEREKDPALYAYEQVYTVGENLFRRRGLIGALGVEEFNKPHGIFRHEMTIRSGTDDRMKLMAATKAQLSPVFGVFPDPQSIVRNALKPYFNSDPDFYGTTGNDGVEHRCWAIRDRDVFTTLTTAFKFTEVFIADGHHRYTTALNYHKAHPDNERAGKALFVLVPIEDPGMIVLPYHRILTGLQNYDANALVRAIDRDERFHITSAPQGPEDLQALQESLADAGHHAVGLYDPDTRHTYVVSSIAVDPLADVTPDRPSPWRDLDVAVLHHGLIDGVIRPQFGGEAVAYQYTHSLDELVRRSHGDPGRLGVIVQATPLEAVCEVARHNEVMPPKSTFFYPKLATGLVINPLD